MRRTRPSIADVTQSAPKPAATPRDALPTGSSPTTRFEPGSTWATVRASPLATHSAPAPNASAVGSPRTSICVIGCSGSIRDTVPSSALATQTEPPPDDDRRRAPADGILRA